MKGGFWLGLILGVPLAIAANVMTRPVQNRLDSRIRSRALRRTRNMRQDYETAKRYKERPEEFYEYMLSSVVMLLSWTVGMALVIVALLFAFLAARYFGITDDAQMIVVGILLLLALGGSLVGVRRRDEALKNAYRFRRFSEYESQVKRMLDSDDAES